MPLVHLVSLLLYFLLLLVLLLAVVLAVPQFWWTFSELLEPVAIVPQLLVLRRCRDAGKLVCENELRRRCFQMIS